MITAEFSVETANVALVDLDGILQRANDLSEPEVDAIRYARYALLRERDTSPQPDIKEP